MSQAKIILVAGPTASGKSAFALDLARQMKGSIINVDALQIYKGLPILSSQPKASDQHNTPHYLYGTREPTERSSAGQWVQMAQDAIAAALNTGRLPILVGGTGLYFRALLGGLANIPPIPEEIRAAAQVNYEVWGEDKFRQELMKIDPSSALKLARHDRQRLIRAYEVAIHTGHPLRYWHEQPRVPSPYSPESHLLMPERDDLYARCNQRFKHMIKEGALDEVRAFLHTPLPENLPVMKTLGLRELMSHLKGEISLEEAIRKAQQTTRNYAKRQMTWFRHQWSY